MDKSASVVAQAAGRSTSFPAVMKLGEITTTPLYAALLLRVTLGLMFLAHLYWKFEILPGGLHAWWSNLSANGYPSVVLLYAISAEIAAAILLIPGIYVRGVSLYALPLTVGASHFWLVRKGFYFTAAGGELPLAWSIMLILQALLGSGPYALRGTAMKSRHAG
ncbi:MAG TPA: DoxX family membrane protein [Steroidobacteraceae bacterium]|nr:DoxX family membrane protein [Steroidobacteraceae bacterium]